MPVRLWPALEAGLMSILVPGSARSCSVLKSQNAIVGPLPCQPRSWSAISRKRYGAVTAVDGVSFEIRSGEIFGLIGPNGAGKTTTVECLIGLRQPDEGRIEVCGIDARRRPRDVKQRIGAALQTTALQDRITPREALDLFGAFYGGLVPSDQLLRAIRTRRDRPTRRSTRCPADRSSGSRWRWRS